MSSFSAQIRKARSRLIRMHYDAKVGHLGGNLSSLDALMVLYHSFLGPSDGFVLSKGHSAGAAYVAAWSKGILSDEDLSSFHGDGTSLPGHPPSSGVAGMTFGTGSLGHGVSLAAGLALGKRIREETGTVYCLTSDGEWQEGSMWEALRFSLNQNLDNLVILIDANGWQGFSRTEEIAGTDALEKQLNSFGSAVLRVDGHDFSAVRDAIAVARGIQTSIILDTVKGFCWPEYSDELASHYLPPSRASFSDEGYTKQ